MRPVAIFTNSVSAFPVGYSLEKPIALERSEEH